MDVIVIETPQLGDRSYLVHDGAVALVIDPQRDTDRVDAVARETGVVITHVAETHLHNDYVTGGYELARAHGAQYLVNAADPVKFDREPVTDGQVIQVGNLSVTVVATPGHTHTHLSYIVSDGTTEAVFSGGSLLFGSVGRTDLVAATDTVGLTHDQYASVRKLVDEAEHDAALFPTHGFGSFCSSGPATGAGSSTIGEQLTANHALTDADEEHFVADLIANLTAYPSYYAHMAPANTQGPGPANLQVPESLDAAELTRRLAGGEWVVDLRNRVAFSSNHLQGAVSFEYGNGSNFTTYLGWVLPWNEQLTLVGAHADVEDAIRDLSRIGIDSPDAAIGTEPHALAPDAPVASYPRVGWTELLRDRAAGDVLLDTRRTDEFADSRLLGAMNVPLHELLSRMDEIPAGTIWVHCGSGYRAGVAASLLQRAGRDVVHVDASFGDAEAAGLPMAEQAV
ncbi:hydroxyacylglutathione hydrolase [Cryobacterium sp. MP_M5]|uniref:MBL fold metallo-hydrolase n=1 Tax=unclassified Cryobacterium TaxID=2649013 RepID=UPI0018C9FC81|nr:MULTISPECIES: MBL fold metallo-hydrolase [unclassified Cryobacterium]MBG6058143.1 glyoxylase-like metal-dependent hydrolase (beta-lactamase superfamily II)/rhodanese-related sulfurtransferase [Cryobacterium sp. MP_M3]MEC5176613.1 hydroxyacylglutathione hydrolase [Cryobacterium sp. MP_M5]